MSALIDGEEFIMLTRTLIRVFGPTKAIILQHIHQRSKIAYRGEVGETRMSQAEIAEDTGLSRSTVYRGLKDLLADGIMSIKEHGRARPDGTCDRTRTYEIDYSKIPEIGAKSSDRDTDPKTSDRESQSAKARNGASIGKKLFEEVSPPAPPQAGGDQPELFADGDRGRVTRAEKKRARDPHHLAAAFEPIWKTYSSEGGSKGKKAEARADFEAALKRGATCGEILTAVENHRAARVAYYEIWGVWPSLVHACRFFRNNLEDFDHPWTQDELRYWPPPRGKDWEHTKKRRSVEEILATGANY